MKVLFMKSWLSRPSAGFNDLLRGPNGSGNASLVYCEKHFVRHCLSPPAIRDSAAAHETDLDQAHFLSELNNLLIHINIKSIRKI
jgi:hypothetical protein